MSYCISAPRMPSARARTIENDMGIFEAVRRLQKLNAHVQLLAATSAATTTAASSTAAIEVVAIRDCTAVEEVLRSHDHRVHDVAHGPIRENGRRPYANHLSHGVICMAELGAGAAALRAWADNNGAESQVPVDEWNLSAATLDRKAVLALRGERKQYTGLVDFFAAECAAS